MKYYFFKTVRDGSRNRLNPLPFQTASDGTAIIQKLNTQVAAGGMKLREAYPIGTVFCSSMCELSARAGTPYYCAGDIYPILEGNSNYDFNLPTPTREMLDAYADYKQKAKQEAARLLPLRNEHIGSLKLSLTAEDTILRAGVRTLFDLVGLTEGDFKRLSRAKAPVMEDIRWALSSRGLSFGMHTMNLSGLGHDYLREGNPFFKA